MTRDTGGEAAHYRRRLREAEAERDRLHDRLHALQRREVERIAAAAGLVVPAALFATGRPLADFLDDFGDVDQDQVHTIAAEAVRTLGLATTDGKEGVQTVSWADVLQGRVSG